MPGQTNVECHDLDMCGGTCPKHRPDPDAAERERLRAQVDALRAALLDPREHPRPTPRFER